MIEIKNKHYKWMVPGNEEISGEFISFTSCVLIEVAWASVLLHFGLFCISDALPALDCLKALCKNNNFGEYNKGIVHKL